jgi:hypothetical protein
MRRNWVISAGLVAAAVVVGVAGWSGNPLTLPLAFAFPALWALSPSRLVATLVSMGYFLAASRGLPQGVANFYCNDFGAGVGLWIAASSAFVFVHALLWTRESGWRTARYGVAIILMSVPPFGIVGWAHPVTATGILFPGWGWWGVAAAVIGLLAMTTRIWQLVTVVICALWAASALIWSEPSAPEGWTGIDTQFRGSEGQYADFAQQRETIDLVLEAAADGARVVVLPESAIGIWTPTVERLWIDALRDLDAVVNAGAIVVDSDGYDNVMVEITGGGSRILYRERMPVPVSMWQPWLGWWGEGGGARAHFFVNPVAVSNSRTILPLICYEQLIVWPVLQSALYSPDAIIATGNGWWTEDTSIVHIQRAGAEAWARLFGLPLVVAFNT